MEDNFTLHLKNLCVTYIQNGHKIPILKNISFSVRQGEVVSLLGESGSGKTTIAKTITGLLPPSAQVQHGILTVGDNLSVDLSQSSISWNKIRGTVIGLVFQDARLALNPLYTIKEHFREIMLIHNAKQKSDLLQSATSLLELLGFTEPEAILNSYPFQLSGGMCQRVCIALALYLRPSVLIADEPTSALDTASQKEVINLLKYVQRELGVAMLFITHDISVAKAISDRIVVLSKGDIVEIGETHIVLSHPTTGYMRELLALRSVKTTIAKRAADAINPIIDIIDLYKSYSKNNVVLKGLCLTIYENEIVGILGSSGCGKSTLAKCIVGTETVSSGEILYCGKNLIGMKGKTKRNLCRYIQMIFQDARASLNPSRTAIELVQEPLNYLKVGSKKNRYEKAFMLLEQVGIDDDAKHRRPPQLSTGQCQRIAIARALSLNPKLLICDEAVSALDVRVQMQILELLIQLHKEFDFAILMVSHDIRVLQQLCHRIAVMHDGVFCEIGNTDSILLASKSSHTQRLLECELEF